MQDKIRAAKAKRKGKAEKNLASNMKKEDVDLVDEGILPNIIKKGIAKHKDAVEKEKIKKRKAVPYQTLAAEHKPEGEFVDEATRLKKEKGYDKGGGKDKALNFVKSKIRKEIGKPEGQQKKVKGAKSSSGTGKYLKRAQDKKAYVAKAKKAGFKSTQDYTNTVARYGSEDNYKKGKGLGT